MKYNTKKYVALLLGMCLALNLFITAAAENDVAAVSSETEKVNAVAETNDVFEEIFNSSVIINGGSPYYYLNGTKTYFDKDNTAYAPPYADGEVLVPADTLGKILKITVAYDMDADEITITKDDTVIKTRLGEDAMYVNGIEKYIPVPTQYNGTTSFLPFITIARAVGYNTYSRGKLFIATMHEAFNNDFVASSENLDQIHSDSIYIKDFSGVTAKDTYLNYADWTFHDWGNENGDERGTRGYTEEEGISKYSMYADAVESSFAGGMSKNSYDFDKSNTAYKINYALKTSADYKGNSPVIVLLFYQNTKYVTSKFIPINDYSSEKWTYGEYVFDKSQYPEADVNKINVVYATSRGDNTSEFGGRVYYGYTAFSSYGIENADKVATVNKLSDKFLESLMEYGFEENERNKGWNYNDWGTSNRPSAGYKYTDEAYTGKSAVALNAVQTDFAGIQSPLVKIDNCRSFEVRFRYKKSPDYAYNKPSVGFLFCDASGAFKQYVSVADLPSTSTTDWVEASMVIDNYKLGEQFNNGRTQFRAVVMTAVSNANDTNIAKGTLTIDDIKILKYLQTDGNIIAEFKTDAYASWHKLGEDVVLRCLEPKKISAMQSVTGMIYDLYGTKIDEITLDIDTVLKDGWRWKPSDVGYYNVYLYGNSIDGARYSLVTYTNKRYNNLIGNFEISRYQIGVVEKDAKPMDERNESFYVSSTADDAEVDQLRTAEMLGFYGVRFHYISWGSPAGGLIKGINDVQGEYDWTRPDKQFENVEKYGFKGVIANFFNTPKWAVAPEYRNIPGNTIAGPWIYNCYPPEDMKYLEDFCTEIVKRYKDRNVTMWEFWNEPQMGKTAFWYGTPAEYSEMQKAAYKAIKKADPNAVVTMGSQGIQQSYYSFYEELIKDPEFYASFDVLPIHARYFPNTQFKAISEKLGLEPKPYINSEGYLSNYYKRGEPTDQKGEALYWLMCVMSHVKDNCKIFTQFSTVDNGCDEERNFLEANGSSAQHYCLFVNNPHLEPKLSALTAFNFIDLIEKDFSYKSEYVLADGQKAVAFNNGDNALLVLWNSEGDDFKLDDKIRGLLKEDSTFIDFQGKKVSMDDMKAQTAYFISNVDMDKLNALEISEDKVLNPEFMSPFFTCRETLRAEDISDSIPRMTSYPIKPFNENTFELASDLVWNEADTLKWVSSENAKQPDGFSARHIAHIDEDGLYVLIDVEDSVFTPPGLESIDRMWQSDSVQLAFDTKYTASQNDRVEVQIGKKPEGDRIYKQDAPFVGSDLPQEWTDSGNIMKYGKVKIEETEKGMMYKIFIPSTELYPFTYPGKNEYVRISYLINCNDGDGRIGYLEWSSGIGASKNGNLYGVLNYYFPPVEDEE